MDEVLNEMLGGDKYKSNTRKPINKKHLLKVFKEDLKNAEQLRKEIDTDIKTWKREYEGEPYGNEKKGYSKIVARDIKKQSEWQHPALVEPFISTPDIIKARPVTWEDKEIAPKIEILLNTQFCRQFNRYNFINKAIRVLDQEGTCITRLGWEYEEKEIEVEKIVEVPNPELEQGMVYLQQIQEQLPILQQAVQMGQADPAMLEQAQSQMQQIQSELEQLPQTIEQVEIAIERKPIKNHPTAVVCRNEDIFIDPTCQDDFDKAQFIIHRYESDLSSLKQAGIYKHLDEIDMNAGHPDSDGDYDSPDTTKFEFRDKARKKLLVYEYWGNYDINDDGIVEPIVCTWINNTIIRLEENPFPDRKPPFVITPFNVIPFTLYGESNAELLSDIQKIKTAIYRGFIDNMARSNNAQLGLRKGSLDTYNLKRYMSGENFEYNGSPNDFFQGHFNEFPSSAFNLLNTLNAEAESITGINSYPTGLNSNGTGATALGLQQVMDSATTRRLNIVRNIAENLVKPILRKWLAYDSKFLDEEAQFRITNEEFVFIKRDDLGANIDIDLSISTSDDNKALAQELAFLLQTIAPSEDAEIRRGLMAEICDLYRRPDLKHKLLNIEPPEPDPMQQQMQQLQIEMLQAQVAELQAKTARTQADVPLKEAKVETELAKADNIGSRTDKQDLDYLQQFNGTKEQRLNEQRILQNQLNMDRDTLKMIGSSFAKHNI